jgi:hypothetical protein
VVGKEPLETLHTFRTGAGLGWAEAAGGQHVHVHNCCNQHLDLMPWRNLARVCIPMFSSRPGHARDAGLKSWKHAVFFGNNLVTKQTSGTVSIGDAVLVTKERGTAQGGALVWKKAEC